MYFWLLFAILVSFGIGLAIYLFLTASDIEDDLLQ